MVRDRTRGLRVSTAYVYVEDAPPPPPLPVSDIDKASPVRRNIISLEMPDQVGCFPADLTAVSQYDLIQLRQPSAPSFRHLPSLIVLSLLGVEGG